MPKNAASAGSGSYREGWLAPRVSGGQATADRSFAGKPRVQELEQQNCAALEERLAVSVVVDEDNLQAQFCRGYARPRASACQFVWIFLDILLRSWQATERGNA